MGVDTYVSRTPDLYLTAEDLAAFRDLELPLSEWVANEESVSFRGERYAFVCMEVTDRTLTYAWLPAADVREMAAAFLACDPEEVAGRPLGGRKVTAREIYGLRTVLSICAERGLGLLGL